MAYAKLASASGISVVGRASGPPRNRGTSLSEFTEAWRLDGIGGVTGTVWYISWNATSPSAEDRLTISQRSVEEGFRLQRHQNESARGRNPARGTVTSQQNRDGLSSPNI
jgi:hypothetical protein